MRRRFIALFLLTLCLPLCAGASAPAPSELATISQQDERFASFQYDYWTMPFRCTGCGPASVANALIASLGVTDADAAAGLLLDVLHLLTRHGQSDTLVFDNLENMTAPSWRQYFPTLDPLLAGWGGDYLFSNDPLDTAILSEGAARAGQTPLLLVRPLRDDTRWDFLCSAARYLYTSGYDAAAISIALLGAGTNASHSAFRSGEAGHFVTLYVPVREFCEEGTYYVIDSLPRALEGEPFDELDPAADYTHPYVFNRYSTLSYEVRPFLEQCRVERVSRTMLRITPAQPFDGMRLAVQEAAVAAAVYGPYLDSAGFLSGGKAFIHIPLPSE